MTFLVHTTNTNFFQRFARTIKGAAIAGVALAMLSGGAWAQAPAAPTSAPDLKAGFDTGVLDTDNITYETALEFQISCPAGTAGGSVQFVLDGAVVDTQSCFAEGDTATSARISNVAEGDRSVTVRAVNSAGQASTDSPALTVKVDTTPPTVQSFTGTRNVVGDAPFTGTVTYSEPVWFLSLANAGVATPVASSSDGEVRDATAQGGSTIGGNLFADTYTVTIDPYSSRVNSSIDGQAQNGGQDVAGNRGQIAGRLTQSFPVNGSADTTPPVVQSISVAGSPYANATSVTFNVTFDEAVQNLSTNAVELATTGTATGSVQIPAIVSGTTYAFQVTGISGAGTIGLNVKANSTITDSSGNGNGTNGHVAAFTGSTHTVAQADLKVVTYGTGSGTIDSSPERTSGAAAYDFGNQAQGVNSASHSFGYGNVVTNTYLTIQNFAISGTHASDFVLSPNPTQNGSFGMIGGSSNAVAVKFNPSGLGTRTATLTIKSTDPDEGSFVINLTGTGVAGAGANLAITQGDNQTSVVGNAHPAALQVRLTDANGNNVAGQTVTFTAPSSGAGASLNVTSGTTDASGLIAVTATANNIAGSYQVTASTSGASDVTFNLTNTAGTAAGLSAQSGSGQTALLNSAFGSALTARVTDANGNPKAGETVTFAVNAGGNGQSATLSASSAVTDANGLASVTATSNGVEGAFTVTASSGALTPVSFSLTNRAGPTAQETQEEISETIRRSAQQLMNIQPSFTGLLNGQTQSSGAGNSIGVVSMRGSSDAYDFAFKSANTGGGSTSSKQGSFEAWAQIYGSHSKIGTTEGTVWAGYLGGHYAWKDNNIVGVVGQFDWTDSRDTAGTSGSNGRGWMVGPYVAGQFEDQNLFYEASLRYGQAANKISPIGTYEDAYDTTRLMATGKLSGQFEKNGFVITPSVSAAWFQETQKAYTDSLGTLVPQTTVSFGEVSFGPRVSKTIALNNGAIATPSLQLEGAYNFDLSSTASSATNPGVEEFRAKLSSGVIIVLPNDAMRINANAFYDGIGVQSYEVYGGTLTFTMSF